MRYTHFSWPMGALLAAACTVSSSGQVLRAGDRDDFSYDSSVDDLGPEHMRAPFFHWMTQVYQVNRAYHNGQPAPFDTMEPRWGLGFSFRDLPALPDEAMVRIRAARVDTLGDAIRLLYLDPEGATRSFGWELPVQTLYQKLGGQGTWAVGETFTFELPLARLPTRTKQTVDLLPLIREAGYLDVFVGMSTTVDWVEVVVPGPGTSALLGMGVVVATRRRRPTA